MHRIHKDEIPNKVAKKSLTEYKNQLKKALQNPSLSATQRKDLKKRLKTAGCCRNYKNEKPLKGAINN